MINKRVARSCALAAMLLVFYGCTPPASPAESASPPPERKEVRLNTVSPFGGTDASAADYQELIREYQLEYPHVRVIDESSVSDEVWKSKVMADFAAGNEPDVLFFFTGSKARDIIAHDKLIPLSAIQEIYPDYGQNLKPDALGQMVEMDGEVYALPVRGVWEGIFCNKDLFLQNHLPLPYDWESFIQAVEGFSQTNIVPIAASFSDVPHYLVENLILSAGGVEDHRFNPRSGLGLQQYPQSWLDGLSMLCTLYEMDAFPDDVNATSNDAAEQLFMDKRAAMLVSGSWKSGAIPDQVYTTVLPFPPMEGSSMEPGDIISGYTMGFSITRKAWEDENKRDAAAQFVMKMTSNASISVFAKVAGNPAAEIELPDGLTPLEKAGIELVQGAKRADRPIDSRLATRAWDKLYTSITPLVTGRVTPEELLNEVAQRNY